MWTRVRIHMSNSGNNKPVSKQALYSMVSSHAKTVINRLITLSESKNENVALGACKILLNKTLPDIRTLEVNQIPKIEELITEDKKANVDIKEMTEEESRIY